MKSREAVLKAKRFEVSEKGRKAEDLSAMARDLEAMASDLERQILAEEERTGIRDRNHFSYSTFAKAATLRRDKLLVSVNDIRAQLEAARTQHETAREALRALEADEARETSRQAIKLERNGVLYS